jgi:methionyl aminopeptidase
MNNDFIRSGQITAEVIQAMVPKIVAGAIPEDIDAEAEALIRSLGGSPAFKGYNGFSKTACISVNSVLVHGIPNQTPFKPGDVVSLDLGTNYNGWITDSAVTIALEPVSKDTNRLITATKQALAAGIAQAIVGNRIGDISAAIQAVADQANLGISYELAGHGVGRNLHQPPSIPNHGQAGTGPQIKEGMTLAIEPMFTGRPDLKSSHKSATQTGPDGWGVMIKNGSNGAHFEHTIEVTKDTAKIITAPVDTSGFVW